MVLDSLLALQPRDDTGGGGGGQKREELVMAIATDLLDQVRVGRMEALLLAWLLCMPTPVSPHVVMLHRLQQGFHALPGCMAPFCSFAASHARQQHPAISAKHTC